ncbi:MAG: hypothetical protein ABSE63_06020 [Thermoguttaceae bacterium]|jgi:hypothetical protein
MKKHWKLTVFLTIVFLLGFSILVKAISIEKSYDQISAMAARGPVIHGMVFKDYPQLPGFNSFKSLDGIPGDLIPNPGLNLSLKPNVSCPRRSFFMLIPTSWDVLFLPIPTQWDDVKIILISPKKAEKIEN